MHFDSQIWGDVSTWALVIVTLVGVSAAAVAGVYAGKIYRIERDRDQKQTEVDRREQAILVSAWGEVIVSGSSEFHTSVGVVAVALNGSSQPVYKVEITWYKGDEGFLVAGTGVIPPNTPYQLPMDDYSFLNLLDPVDQKRPSVDHALSIVKRLRIAIAFTDSQNQRWIRGRDGLLSRDESS